MGHSLMWKTLDPWGKNVAQHLFDLGPSQKFLLENVHGKGEVEDTTLSSCISTMIADGELVQDTLL